MPSLEWIGKDKVVNHHQEVPYRVLVCRKGTRICRFYEKYRASA